MYRAIGITDDKKASLKGERTLLLFIFLSPLFLYFLAVLGLRCCVRAFSSCGQPGPPSDCGVSSYCKALALAHELRSLQHTSSVVGAHGLSCSAACGIFPTRDPTCVSCIGRQILIHCTTREAQNTAFRVHITWIHFLALPEPAMGVQEIYLIHLSLFPQHGTGNTTAIWRLHLR